MRLISLSFLLIFLVSLFSCKKSAVGNKAVSSNIDLAIEGKPLREILRNIHQYEGEEVTLTGQVISNTECPPEPYMSQGKGKFKTYFRQEDRCILICSDTEIDAAMKEITVSVVKDRDGRFYFKVSSKF